MQLACEERQDFAELLAGLSPEQWEQPSLCEHWRVRDVVAHVLSFEELSRWEVVRRFVKGGLVTNRINAIGVAEYAKRTPKQLTELMRASIPPRGFTTGFGGMIALVDGTVHHQDIRRSLGRPRAVPEDRLQRVLGLVPGNPRLGAGRRIRGLRLRANDIDWEHGRGPEVTGSGEALLMAMTGRPAALADLDGPGLPTLAKRLTK
jgi:uncharacterized protein (TIGR03083 family)